MKSFWLLSQFSDVDTDLVERAAQKPARKKTVIRFISAAAAAVLLVVGVGAYLVLDNGSSSAVDVPGGDTTTTVITPTTENPEDNPNGTGGDSWGCPVHSSLYHGFGGELHDYICTLVGEERVSQYLEEMSRLDKEVYHKDTVYPYDECLHPNNTLPNFIKEFQVTREQFVEAMGWGEYLDHVYQDFYPYDEDGHYYHFTYGDVVEALYGDNPHFTDWVFHSTANYADEYLYQDFYYDDWVQIKRNGDPLWDYIYEHFNADTVSDFRYACRNLEDKEAYNIFHLVQFYGIDRETFIEVYGWADKLDKKATEHFPYAPYTYRQYVDAVYGEDTTLRRWLFNAWVFHPEYPSLEEFAALTEGDRFYCAPFTVTPLKAIRVCTEHNPLYHDLSYFREEWVRKFKTAYAGKGEEAINVVNYVKFMRVDRYFIAEAYDFDRALDWDTIADHGEGCPYTYGQFLRAICNEDAALTQWVFAPASTWPKAEQWPPQGEWPPQGYGYAGDAYLDDCTVHNRVYHDLTYFPQSMVDEYKALVGSDDPEDYNVIDFINYHQISRVSFCNYIGLDYYGDRRLKEIPYHCKDGSYTYKQFVDAIYDNDVAALQRIFGVVPNSVNITTTTTDPNWGRDEFGNTTTSRKNP